MKKKNLKNKFLNGLKIIRKIIGWTVFTVICILVLIFLMVQIPYVQNRIKDKVIASLSVKLNTKLEINDLQLNLGGKIVLNGVFLTDLQHDTLLYANKISVWFQPMALFHKNIKVTSIKLENSFFTYLVADTSGKTNIDFIIKAFADTISKPKTNTQSAWKFSVNHVSLQHVRVNYNNKADSLNMLVDIGQSQIDMPETDIKLKRYVVQSLILSNTMGKLTTYSRGIKKVRKIQPIINDSLKSNSTNPIMVTIIKKILVRNISLATTDLVSKASNYFRMDSAQIIPNTIDLPKKLVSIDRMFIRHGIISVIIANEGQKTKKELDQISDKTGWKISLQSGTIAIDSIEVSNMIAKKNDGLHIDPIVSLSHFEATTNNNFYTSGSWRSNIASLQFLDNKTQQKTILSARTTFVSGNISAEAINLKTGSSFIKANAYANLSHLVKGKVPDFHLQVYSSSLNRGDFASYFPFDSILHHYALPDHLELTCNLTSKEQHINGEGSLLTNLGNVTFQTQLLQANPITSSTYSLKLKTENLKIGEILKNPALGQLSANVKLSGEGTDPYTMNLIATIAIDSISTKNRNYRSITINSQLMDGNILLDVISNEPDAIFHLMADGHVSRKATTVHIKTSINNMDLRAMGLIKDTVAFSGYISANYKGSDFNHFEAVTDTFRLHVTFPGQEVNLHNKFSYQTNGDTIHTFFDSEPFGFNYSGNMNFAEIPRSLGRYMGKFDVTNDKKSQTRDSDFFKVDIAIKDLTVLGSLLSKQLSIPDKGTITASLAKGNFVAGANFKYIEYGAYEFEKLNLQITGQDSTLAVNFSVGSANTPIQLIKDIDVSGKYNAGLFESRLKFSDEKGDPWFNIATKGNVKTSQRQFSLHDSLMINYDLWNIPADNKITYSEKGLTFTDVSFSQHDKQISFNNNTLHPEELELGFKNINMAGLSAFWKGDTSAFTGLLNGKITAFHLLDKTQTPVFNANIAVNNITVYGQQVGDLSLKASNTENPDVAMVDLKLGTDTMLFYLKGDYGFKQGGPIHFNLSTKNFNIASLAPFTEKAISQAHGNISSSLDISGSITSPVLSGFIGFNNVYAYINSLQTAFQVNHQQINFNNNKINFSSFTIEDAKGKPLVVNGNITVSNFKNIQYNLDLNPTNFLAYNVTATNQPDKKSKAIVSGEISIKGTNNYPVVKANLQMDEGSSLFYKVTKHNTNVSSKGVVEFLGEPEAQPEPPSVSIMKNLNLTANISIADGTPFTIITDPARNMGLNLTAGGILSLKQLPSQSPYLNGRVNISGGKYTLNISGLKRTFTISDSSTMTWQGNISNPDMNLKAYYIVNTPSSELMGVADQKYLTAIPFMVNLNIRGQLSQPSFNFQLSLPHEYENTYGDVVARLQIINSDETELNQKAITLLLFGSFGLSNFSNIIYNGSGGTNALISNALNQVSSQVVKFVDLHFDLQSYDNYGGTTGENLRTQIKISASKKFLNQRLTTQLGGTFVLQGDVEEQNKSFYQRIVPEFNVEYTLNSQRTWKIKGFRQSEYRGLVEGKVVSLGTGVVFEKNYEHINDLFRKKPEKKKSTTLVLNPKK